MGTPEYYWQVSLNGMCYVDLVARVWERTGDDSVMKEFYESVKRVNTYTMGLSKGPGAAISMPDIGGMEWFEVGEWAGMATHTGGLRLAELRMVEHMARAMERPEELEMLGVVRTSHAAEDLQALLKRTATGNWWLKRPISEKQITDLGLPERIFDFLLERDRR